MMSNERRREIYLRNRSEPTPAQRRRLKQKTPHHELVGKYGRLRRRHERKLMRESKQLSAFRVALMRMSPSQRADWYRKNDVM